MPRGGEISLFCNNNEKYIDLLQRRLDLSHPNWIVKYDDTESDIEAIIAAEAKILVCVPGLRFQFYHHGFKKENIIWLSTMEYASLNLSRVLTKVNQLSGVQ